MSHLTREDSMNINENNINRSILTYGGIDKNGFQFFENTTLFIEKHQGNVRFFEQIKKDNGHLNIGIVSIATLVNQETKDVKTWENPKLKEMLKKLKIKVAQ
tara:strand:- start:227 stop:532 length:306 start_codon:yes stop_codon:yes gene_type:complete